MRVMVVWPGATWSTADVARGWADGLEACGVEVIRFRLDLRIEWLSLHLTEEEAHAPEAQTNVRRMAAESLAGALYEWRPDLVLVIDGKDIPAGVWKGMRLRGERLVLLHTESPYEDRRIETMHWCAGLHLVNDPSGAERLRRHGAQAEYAPHAYAPHIHHPGNGQVRKGTVFVGSGFSGRAAFLAEVDWARAGPLTLAGHWRRIAVDRPPPPEIAPYISDLPEPLPNEDAAELYRTSAIGLNLYRTDHLDNDSPEGWAIGPREVEMAACGLPFLRQSRPEGDQLFPFLPVFSSPEELTDLAAWWLAHPETRKAAAAAALAAVADRTFDASAAALLRRVG